MQEHSGILSFSHHLLGSRPPATTPLQTNTLKNGLHVVVFCLLLISRYYHRVKFDTRLIYSGLQEHVEDAGFSTPGRAQSTCCWATSTQIFFRSVQHLARTHRWLSPLCETGFKKADVRSTIRHAFRYLGHYAGFGRFPGLVFGDLAARCQENHDSSGHSHDGGGRGSERLHFSQVVLDRARKTIAKHVAL